MSLSAQDMEEGVCRSESSDSDCSSPRGPKGGGTLKTCAVCLEDYRSASPTAIAQCAAKSQSLSEVSVEEGRRCGGCFCKHRPTSR